MRVSPTVLAFIAASGLVGLSSSQAEANPLPETQATSPSGVNQDPSGDLLSRGSADPEARVDDVAQPQSLQEARQAVGQGAAALSPQSDSVSPPALSPESVTPQVPSSDAEAAIRALREQIHHHQAAQQVNPAELLGQSQPTLPASIPLEPNSDDAAVSPEAIEPPSVEPLQAVDRQNAEALSPVQTGDNAASPGAGEMEPPASVESPADDRPTVAQGSREDILQNAPELSPEQIERIRQAAEEDAGSEIGAPEDAETPAEPEGEEAEDMEADPEADGAEAEEEADPRVLVAEVQVEAAEGELDEDLRTLVYDEIETRPGRTTTRTQLQQDINNIFATGFFSAVDAVPEDTDLGVRVTYVVQPNPVLTDVQVEGNQVISDDEITTIFSDQIGEIINLREFQDGILELNELYQEQGYVLAQVIAAPEVSEDGVVTLEVAEGVIEDIEVRFLNEEGEAFVDGEPVDGRTHDYIVTREFETQPGDVFNQAQIEQDFQNVFALQIFEDVTPGLEPGDEDPRKVKVIVNVTERSTGSVAAGLGFNFTGDLFGTVSFRQDNFGGNNQKLSAEAQLSTRDILFDISFTDPWIAGDPFRTSYTVNAFARRSINLNFDGGPNPIDLPNGDRVRIRRLGGEVSFRRPLSDNWAVTVGTRVQNISSRDADGRVQAFDADGNPITFSAATGGGGVDDLWTFPVSVSWDRRNDSFNPTSGGILRLNTEQSVPLGRGSIFMNRLRGSYSHYIPVSWINFNEGPQALAFNVQVGSIVGDVPPYEAFALGGSQLYSRLRGGGSGQWPQLRPVLRRVPFPACFRSWGVRLFLDAGSDLGSGNAVPGAPGPSRGKPGSGFGYGAGVRVQTPSGSPTH
jgi:outer membrane protein insertion porin family